MCHTVQEHIVQSVNVCLRKRAKKNSCIISHPHKTHMQIKTECDETEFHN